MQIIDNHIYYSCSIIISNNLNMHDDIHNDISERLQIIKREFNSEIKRDPSIDEVIEFFSKNDNMYLLDNFLKNII